MNLENKKIFVQTYMPNYGYCYLRSPQLTNSDSIKIIKFINKLRKEFVHIETERLKPLLEQEFKSTLLCKVKNIPDPDFSERNFEQIFVFSDDLTGDEIILPLNINDFKKTNFQFVNYHDELPVKAKNSKKTIKSILICFIILNITFTLYLIVQYKYKTEKIEEQEDSLNIKKIEEKKSAQ